MDVACIPRDANRLWTDLPLLLDVETAKQLPQVSGRYMRTLCSTGKVQAIKCGKNWRVNRDSLLAYCGLA